MAEADVRVLVGVSRTAADGGDSAAHIKKELEAIMKEIGPVKVGVDFGDGSSQGSTWAKQFKTDIVNSLKGIERQAASAIDPIKDLVRLVDELNKKPFQAIFSTDNSVAQKEQIGQYAEAVRKYVREIKEGYEAVGKIVTDPRWQAQIGSSMNANLAKLYGGIPEKDIDKLEQRLNHISTLSGSLTIAKDAKQYWDLLTPFLDAAKQIGILKESSTFGIFPEMPTQQISNTAKFAAALTSLKTGATGVGDAVNAVADAMAKEEAATGASNQVYKTHEAAVSAAADAEAEKARQSADLEKKLRAEREALDSVAKSSAKDTSRKRDAADDTAGTDEDGVDYASLLKQMADMSSRAHALIDSQIDAPNTDTEQNLINTLNVVDAVLDDCGRSADELEGALARAGITGTEEIGELSVSISTVRQHLASMGTTGNVTLNQLSALAARMHKTLNANDDQRGTRWFNTLRENASLLDTVLEECGRNAASLTEALNNHGVDGANMYRAATMSLNEFNRQVAIALENRAALNRSSAEYDVEKGELLNLINSTRSGLRRALDAEDITEADSASIDALIDRALQAKIALKEIDNAHKSIGSKSATAFNEIRGTIQQIAADASLVLESIDAVNKANKEAAKEAKKATGVAANQQAVTDKSKAAEQSKRLKTIRRDISDQVDDLNDLKNLGLDEGAQRSIDVYLSKLAALSERLNELDRSRDRSDGSWEERVSGVANDASALFAEIDGNTELFHSAAQAEVEHKHALEEYGHALRSVTKDIEKYKVANITSVNGVNLTDVASNVTEIETKLRALLNGEKGGGESRTDQIVELTKEVLNLKDVLKDFENTWQGMQVTYKKVDALGKRVQTAVGWTAAKRGSTAEAYSGIEDVAKDYAKFVQDFDALTPDQRAAEFDRLNRELEKYSAIIRGAGKNTQSFADHLGTLAKKFASWFSASQIVMRLYRAFQNMVKSVIEIDTAMTELKKVTDETDYVYNRFLQNAGTHAKELGVTITDIVNATADFARLGYNVEDATTLAKVATVYKNVGDGIENIGDASESIISTMKAFGIEADDAMTIVDKFNNVGNNFAISSKGVGDALMRSASAMHAAGNTLDETIALATAANTIIQNPDSVGTTLKTMSMFLRAAKTEAEAAGEDTDGMAESVSKLRGEILKLTGQKVDIQIDDQTFKSTTQILRELSQVWGDLSDVSKANILEKIGGKRNANVTSALLENFNIVEEVIETAANSANSAMEENEKYLASIQGRIAVFKATVQDLSQTVVNSDLIKFFVDVGAGLVKTIDAVITALNKFVALDKLLIGGGIVTGLLALQSVFAAVASKAVILWHAGKDIAAAWRGTIGVLNRVNDVMIETAVGLGKVGLQISPFALKYTALAVAIGLVITAFSHYKEHQQKLIEDAKAAGAAAAEEAAEITKLADKYEELSQAYRNGVATKEDMLQAQNDIIEKLGLERFEVNELVKEYGDLDTAIKRASLNKLRDDEEKIRQSIVKRKDEIIDQANPFSIFQKNTLAHFGVRWSDDSRDANIAAYNALKNAGFGGTDFSGLDNYGLSAALNFDDDLSTIEGITAAYERVRQMLQVVATEVGSDNNAFYSALSNQELLFRDLIEGYQSDSEQINKYVATEMVMMEELYGNFPTTMAEYNQFKQDLYDKASISGYKNRFVGDADSIKKAIDDVLASESEFARFQPLDGTLVTGWETAYENAKNGFEAVSGVIDEVTGKLTTLATIQDKIAEGFTLTAAEATEFAKTYPEILDGATVTADGQVELNHDVAKSFIDARRDELNASIDAQIKELEGKRAVLEAEKAFAEAQLEIAQSVAEGESEAAKDEAIYRIELGNALAKALIELTGDEAESYKEAARVMTDNTGEFSDKFKIALSSIANNTDQSAKAMADTVSANAHSIAVSIMYAKQAANVFNRALAGYTDETDPNFLNAFYGGKLLGGPVLDSANITFEGTDPESIFNAKSLDDYTLDIKNKIGEYTKAIDQINGQIAVLQALKEAPLSAFKSGSKSGGSGGSGGKDAATKEIEEYIADIDEFYKALKRLEAIQNEMARVQIDLENAVTTQQQVDAQKQLIELYKEQADALADLNRLRKQTIANNKKDLEDLGFIVKYNDATNEFVVENMDHLNELTGANQEATNELRQNTEKLIDTMDEFNKSNQEGDESIEKLTKSIRDGKQSIIDYLNDIVDKANELVDTFQNVYSTLHSAADEYAAGGFITVDTLQSILGLGTQYMQYLMDENGLLVINEDRINEVIAAKTRDLALEQARNYVERLSLALQEDSIEKLDELLYATNEATDATWGLVYANLAYLDLDDEQREAAKHNIDMIRMLAENAIDSIGHTSDEAKNKLNDMKGGLDDIIKYTMDMLKQRLQDEINALNDMKTKFSEIIDLRKKARDEAKAEASYEKEVAKKVSEIAKIQKQIAALSLDTSRDAQAKRMKLEEDLATKQEELTDYQTQHQIEAEDKAYDETQKSFDKKVDEQTKRVEDSMSSYQKMWDMAIDYIENHWDTLYDELIDWNTEYGSVLNQEITDAWENCWNAAQEYGRNVSQMLASLQADIDAMNLSGSSLVVGKAGQDMGGDYGWNGQADLVASKSNKAEERAREGLDPGAVVIGNAGVYMVTGGSYGSGYKTQHLVKWDATKVPGNTKQEAFDILESQGFAAMLKFAKGFEKYHAGGIVGQVASLKQNEVLSVLEKGEAVLDKQKEAGLYRLVDFATTLSDKFSNMIASSGLGQMMNNFKLASNTFALAGIGANGSEGIHFGDVYIYGANDETVAKHREINRQFTNEVLKYLNIKR